MHTICICFYIYVCIYLRFPHQQNKHIYCRDICTNIYIYIYVYVLVHAYIQIYIYIYMFIYIHHIYTHYIYIYIYIHVYTYLHGPDLGPWGPVRPHEACSMGWEALGLHPFVGPMGPHEACNMGRSPWGP